jgi:hypothetical protein
MKVVGVRPGVIKVDLVELLLAFLRPFEQLLMRIIGELGHALMPIEEPRPA